MPQFPSDLDSKIQSVKQAATERSNTEKANVAQSEEQIKSIQAKRDQDFADAEHADKAVTMLGYCESAKSIYVGISDDPNYAKQSADLLSLIESMTTAAESLIVG